MARPKVNGKHIYLGTYDTKREAKQVEEEYRTKRSRLASDITVKELKDRWFEEWGDGRWKASTTVHYRRQTRLFVEQFGSRKAGTISVPEAHHFVSLNPSTAIALSAMFTYARRLGVCSENPFAMAKTPPKVQEIIPGRGALTADEVYKLAGFADRQWLSSMIVFAAFTGLRAGEIYGLRWEDLGDGVIRVRQAISSTTRLIDLPKNSQAREVIFPPQALEAVQSVPRRAGSAYVFPNATGSFWIHATVLDYWHVVRDRFHDSLPDGHWLVERERAWSARRAAESDPVKRRRMENGRLKFHELRHTCATLLLEAGVDDRDVAAQMGHTDSGELVRRVYGHPSRERSLDRVRAGFARVQGEVPVLRKVDGGRAS